MFLREEDILVALFQISKCHLPSTATKTEKHIPNEALPSKHIAVSISKCLDQRMFSLTCPKSYLPFCMMKVIDFPNQDCLKK